MACVTMFVTQFLGGRRTLPSTAANKPIAVSLDNMVMFMTIVHE